MKNKEQLFKILLFIVAIFWGLGFPFASLALASGYSPINIIFFRFLISSIVLTIVFHKHLFKVKRETLFIAPLLGLIIFTGFYFQVTGQSLTSIANTALITQMNIVIIPIMWALIKRERIRAKTIFTTLVAIAGLYFLSVFGKGFGQLNNGDLLVFIGAFLVSLRIIVGTLLQTKYRSNPVNLTIISAYTITVISGVITFSMGDIPTVTLSNLWPLIFLGIVNSAFGYSIQMHALDNLKPETMSLILSFESVVGSIASIFILQETLSINIVVGGSLILAAIIYSNLKIKSIRQRRRFYKGINE
jgi:drug/metabolite transporter (DMT)-like permease